MGGVNTEAKPIEGEFREQGAAPVEETGLAVIPPNAVALSTVDPTEFLSRGVAQANALAALIKEKHLAITIGGGSKPHVLIDGWQTLMALNGVMPYTIESNSTRCKKEDCNVKPGCPGGRLTVHVVTEIRRVADGTVLTRVEAECSQHEGRWGKADDYAVISMAQTRGVGKGCRQLFGWVMALAGFSSTPADEVPRDEDRHDEAPAPTKAPAPKAAAKVPWTDDMRDGFKGIYKSINAEKATDLRALTAINAFSAFMVKECGGKWERLWADDRLRAPAFKVFGMDDPAVAPPPAEQLFDPDNVPA